MLLEKHLRAQSPQCFVFTRAQTKAETQLTAPTKAMETGSWTTGSEGPDYLWLLFAGPGAHDSLVPTSRSESSFEQMKRISS